ncbi:hypothetical protein [Pseudoalteromonas sp. B160]|uniref:hypothetical protein n=1 Tax=Pseudoalteromonas sp. B160 TaxID=630414 RepID=UPI00301DC494
MSTSNKGFSIALLFGVAAALSGCGESTDELDDKLTHQANMSFINSLDYMADFHVKKGVLAPATVVYSIVIISLRAM